ncbi:hypothetical protein AB0L62_07790 [Nocardia asteroides]|uniref:hypothetical protein n=1 Tax=Nocardia asteroides TaxID=1824 RepID=UPI0034441F75
MRPRKRAGFTVAGNVDESHTPARQSLLRLTHCGEGHQLLLGVWERYDGHTSADRFYQQSERQSVTDPGYPFRHAGYLEAIKR